MNASSHPHPFGFHASGPVLAPMPLREVPALQAPLSAPPVASAAPLVRRPEPLMPVCVTCGARRGPLTPRGDRYDSGAQVFICASRDCKPGPLEPAVVGHPATQARPPVTRAAVADAVRTYDALTVEAIVEAACDQARAELRAELTTAAEDAEVLEWFHDRWKATAPLQEGYRAVRRLCAGRRPEHLLSVAEVRTAVDGEAPTAAPLTVTWDGLVSGPQEDRPGESTLVGCTAALGGSAVLALDHDQRVDLAVRLLAVVPPATFCGNTCCGTPTADLIESDPQLWGGIILDVVGTESGECWWCSPACAVAAMTTAGAELQAADHAAAIAPAEHAPAASVVAEDGVAHCQRCGCTAKQACKGGCHWVPNPQLLVLCSSCASAEELAFAALRPQRGQGATS